MLIPRPRSFGGSPLLRFALEQGVDLRAFAPAPFRLLAWGADGHTVRVEGLPAATTFFFRAAAVTAVGTSGAWSLPRARFAFVRTVVDVRVRAPCVYVCGATNAFPC